MRNVSLLAATLAVPALLLAVAPVAAQDAPAMRKLLQCRDLTDPAARLACYDEQVKAVDAAIARRDLLVVDQDQVAATRRSLFGYSLPHIPLLEARAGDTPVAKDDTSSSLPDRLDTTLRSVSRSGDRWMLVLAEGSRWEQVEAGREADDPRAGMAITIRRASLGTYFARIGSHITMRIRRVG